MDITSHIQALRDTGETTIFDDQVTIHDVASIAEAANIGLDAVHILIGDYGGALILHKDTRE